MRQCNRVLSEHPGAGSALGQRSSPGTYRGAWYKHVHQCIKIQLSSTGVGTEGEASSPLKSVCALAAGHSCQQTVLFSVGIDVTWAYCQQVGSVGVVKVLLCTCSDGTTVDSGSVVCGNSVPMRLVRSWNNLHCRAWDTVFVLTRGSHSRVVVDIRLPSIKLVAGLSQAVIIIVGTGYSYDCHT